MCSIVAFESRIDSLALEELDLLLVFLGFFARVEGAKIFAFSRFGIFLFRVQAVFP